MFEISGYYKLMYVFKIYFIIINELYFESFFFIFYVVLEKLVFIKNILTDSVVEINMGYSYYVMDCSVRGVLAFFI